ncbi:MAG: hypothetical protein IPJ55_11735 [Chloracidobacterium sp.]|nr:hypothetical protein [Chloracidobacterium sp.]
MFLVLAVSLFDRATIEEFVTRIPEAAGLMVFGVVLIVVAGVLRWALRTKDAAASEEGTGDSIS